MKQAFAHFLRKFDVDGYSPMSLLNIVLAAITLVGGSLFVVYVGSYGFAGAFHAANGGDRFVFIISLIATPVSFVLLIIRNLKIKSVPKIILYTILQFALAFVIVFYFFIRMIIKGTSIFFGSGNSSSSNSSDSTPLFPSGGKKYTDEEEQYAKANGYFDAHAANNLGFDTSPANTPGFDYTQKRD